ncbi:MAG: protease modulator HflC [Gammaproteobacteria bacterium]|nr:protease modulator HflC [Gammaproteobacteria bacterium]
MNFKGIGSVLVLLVAAFVASMSFFTVSETELAVKFRFGEIIKADYEPGLQFKWPIDNVIKFEKRLMTVDRRPERFLTGGTKYVLVDFFIKWRIVDVAHFYRSTGGSEVVAVTRLISIITDGLRKAVAERSIQQLVSAERSDFMDTMLIATRIVASELGITVADVRVKRIDLPDEVSGSVFDRMRQERVRIAKQLRAEGAQQSEEIMSKADRERTILLADAYKQSEITRGEGDATAASIYANAYSQDGEFYSFHRSLQAYRSAFRGHSDLLVIDPNSEFFDYLKSASGKK